ncbi:MAG: bifunctional nuclease family protein [Bacteroidales bacterium]|nr:bifunctional nuclease family protein [Bacteroidales bacterium]
MDKIRLEIVGMSYSQSQSGAYALILGEVKGKRRLPIIIGGFEAQAIAVELEKMKPTRPLTHDLFKSFADAFLVQLKEVIIDQFKQGVFHAKLVCVQNDVENLIDSRTSDAVALAIRFKCPIFTYEKIMAEAGMLMDENAASAADLAGPVEETANAAFEEHALSELEEMLEKAVDQEDYERASKIRDEIRKRKKE